MALLDILRRVVEREGPLSIARYMELCLHDPLHGYYAVRPGLGEAGDFITAPLVSQMFGELLGLWSAGIWMALGRPSQVRLVELGPGDGTMMSDVLRAGRACPGFLEACEPWLVETSEPLRRRQGETLRQTSPRWAERLTDVPTDAPVILLANEFLDCLPIRQAVRTPTGWRERTVTFTEMGTLAFALGGPVAAPAPSAGAACGSIAEWSDAVADIGAAVGTLVSAPGGAALFIDYGRAGPELGDTLQALRAHRKESPLAHPGDADLTAHVDFAAFLEAARAAGAEVDPIQSQGEFLDALGIRARAAALASSRPDRAPTIRRQLHRLVAPEQMGALFKVAVVRSAGLVAPGFEPRP